MDPAFPGSLIILGFLILGLGSGLTYWILSSPHARSLAFAFFPGVCWYLD
jgi:hypothetical protein